MASNTCFMNFIWEFEVNSFFNGFFNKLVIFWHKLTLNKKKTCILKEKKEKSRHFRNFSRQYHGEYLPKTQVKETLRGSILLVTAEFCRMIPLLKKIFKYNGKNIKFMCRTFSQFSNSSKMLNKSMVLLLAKDKYFPSGSRVY